MKIPVRHLLRVGCVIAVSALLLSSPASAQPKIVGGGPVSNGDYPWMVALANTNNSNLYQSQFCGGALIDPYWVLTAAHCMEGERAGNVTVWAGLRDLDNSAGAVSRRVASIYMHPGFRESIEGDLLNDVALLLLQSPINTITPIAYARRASDAAPDLVVKVLGWGDTQSGQGFPSILQQVNLKIWPISEARHAYRTNSLDNRHVAAYGSGKDACGGDSGGPLFDEDGDNGNPLLIGITSFGLGCADRGIPGIYANVGYYATWIDGFLRQPTSSDPEISVFGGGLLIADGSRVPKVANRTRVPGRLLGGKSATIRFSIANEANTSPLDVQSVSTGNGVFRVKRAPGHVFGGATETLDVEFRAPNRNRTSRAKVRILTNDANNPVYFFRVEGRSRFNKRFRRF